jgi:hypothetical protein
MKFKLISEGARFTVIYPYNHKSEFLICGDVNIGYFNENKWRKQMNLLITMYNLPHTRFLQNNSRLLQ